MLIKLVKFINGSKKKKCVSRQLSIYFHLHIFLFYFHKIKILQKCVFFSLCSRLRLAHSTEEKKEEEEKKH